MADRLTVYTERLSTEWGLERWKGKTVIAHEHFLPLDEFAIKVPLSQRKNVIGYVGRLSEEKGVQNLAKAIPLVVEEIGDASFVLIGEGYLKEEIGESLRKRGLEGKVTLAGRIRHRTLPDHFNQFKLVVIPSLTEGLPNVLIESMSCGVPVLATPVGSIPDLIKHEETGFLLPDSSVEGLARSIVEALRNPKLETISMNGRELVEREFTYQKAAERYTDVFASLAPSPASRSERGPGIRHI
jgi:glycosyltransferase involved in cell wall biosynthesis